MTLEEARGIAARSYCHPTNAHKVLDPDLCEAFALGMLDALATTDADRQQAKLCTAALQKKMMELTSTPYVPGPLPEVFPKPPGWPLPASSWDTSHQDIKATLQSLAEKCIAEANGELAEPAADVPVEVPASRP